MLTPKVPSMQHLARTWHSDPSRVKRDLIKLAVNSPTFSYNPLYHLIADKFRLGVPFSDIEKGISAIKRTWVRENYQSIINLLELEFGELQPDFAPDICRRFYPVGRNLLVPFDLPLCYGLDGELHLPWMIFWRSHPLAGERLSLFATMVAEMLSQDPDLENAEFDIFDLKIPKGAKERSIKKIPLSEIPLLNADRKNYMLEVYAEGYRQAEVALATMNPRPRRPKRPKGTHSGDQTDMFRP